MGGYTPFSDTRRCTCILQELSNFSSYLKNSSWSIRVVISPQGLFFCNNLINESHTRKLVIDIHSYMQLFIQGNELFIYGFVHTRKWLVHARTWVIHIQGNELFIYKEMSYSYKEMNYSYMELFIQGNELFIYLYRTTYATYVCMHCVCIYVW